MRWCLTVLSLLLLAPVLARAQDLDVLLDFIEEHNHRLQAQRQVLTALTAAPPHNGEVLSVLEADQHSVWKHVRLNTALSERIAPAQPGSSSEGVRLDVDGRLYVTLTLPLADYSGRLAVARERQQQRDKEHTHQQQLDATRLGYATLRDQLFAEVVAKLATLEELHATLAAMQAQRQARLAHRALTERRVAEGVEDRDKLWHLDEQLHEMARQLPVQQAKLRQVQMEIALYGGEAWRTVLGWLGEKRSWLPSSAR